MAFTLAPVLCSLLLTGVVKEEDTRFVARFAGMYLAVLRWALSHNMKVIGVALLLLVAAFGAMQFVGGEFMPALEEGNLWVRATMPVDISFDEAARLTGEIRQMFRRSPEVITIVSQLGRPDDGTPHQLFQRGVSCQPQAAQGVATGLGQGSAGGGN